MQFQGMVGHLIRRLHQHSTQVFSLRVREAGFDITSIQFAAMDALAAKPGLDQATLAMTIAYDRATIGAVIDRLESKGLVERTVNTKDRRAKVLCLSEAGRETYEAVLPVVRELQSDIVARLTPAEQTRFLALTGKTLGWERP